MKSRRGSYRKKGKFKLKKNTVYTLFAIGLFLATGLTLLSFLQSGPSAERASGILSEKFGGLSILFPFVLFFFAFLLLHIKKFFLSKPNVAFGYLVFFVSLLGLTRSGIIGQQMFHVLQEILTTVGADLVFLAGFVIGFIVFFDTSIDDLFQGVKTLFANSHRLVPMAAFKRGDKGDKALLDRSKPITIKGGQKDMAEVPAKNSPPPVVNKKEQEELISAKLVSNVLGDTGNGIWEYPSLSLLNEAPGSKAERGDINKIARKIEETLQSFGVEARVAEVNLGPAVTQYALELALGTKVSKITSLANDLALATEAPTGQIRIEAPIPGRNLVGIEIPNRSLEVVNLRTMLASNIMQKSKSKLAVSMGL
ncbi:MAG TPA: DNA translocase FtsK, partial [Patescibacteria group bacterium]|nr:DNA translocase FtsK [Patescibacteria group bacterium]